MTVLHGNEVQHMGLHSHTSSVVSIYVTRFKKEVWGWIILDTQESGNFMWPSALASSRLLVRVVHSSTCTLLVLGRFFFHVSAYFRNNALNLNRDFTHLHKMCIIVVVPWSSSNPTILLPVKNNSLLIHGIKLNWITSLTWHSNLIWY